MSDELYLDYCGRALCVRERVCMSDESSSTLNTPPPIPHNHNINTAQDARCWHKHSHTNLTVDGGRECVCASK